MTGFLAGSLAQAAVAALAASVFLRAFRVRAPAERVRYRFLVLCVPLLAHPVLAFLPFRTGEDFLREAALLSSRRWTETGPAGAGATAAVVVLLALVSLALLLRDLAPPASRATRVPRGESEERLARRVTAMAVGPGLPAPRVLFLDDPALHLYCRGLRSPVLVVSTGALERLSPEELEGALAHEVAHLSGRDVTLGLGLAAVRTLLWFNPVVQLVARRAVLDLEERADDRAAMLTSTAAVSAALSRLCGRSELDDSPFARAGGLALEARRARLLRGDPARPGPGASLRLTAATLSTLLLVFLVV